MFKKILVHTECPVCYGQSEVLCYEEGYNAWKMGMVIQSALPDLDDEERELLLSGICVRCWTSMFDDSNKNLFGEL